MASSLSPGWSFVMLIARCEISTFGTLVSKVYTMCPVVIP